MHKLLIFSIDSFVQLMEECYFFFFLQFYCKCFFLSVGKAYAIFRTKDAADAAISKINSGLVVGGRYVSVVDVIYLISYSLRPKT